MPENDRKQLTLCLIHRHPKILLGMKKRGFGVGRWNGFGGKLKEGESLEDAARRELEEEAGILAKDLTEVGTLDFSWPSNAGILEVHIFRIHDFEGEPVESEEMAPKWFDVSEIPYDAMWADDKHWLPLFLAGKKFSGHFHFDDADGILDYNLVEVDDLKASSKSI